MLKITPDKSFREISDKMHQSMMHEVIPRTIQQGMFGRIYKVNF